MVDVHRAYQSYKRFCCQSGIEPESYMIWLESLVAEGLENQALLVADNERLRQAAETNHEHYLAERRLRETFEASLGSAI